MRGDVTVKIVAQLSGMSEASITRKCQAKTFPGAYQLGEKHCQWHIPADDVLAVIPPSRHAEARQKLELLLQLQDMHKT